MLSGFICLDGQKVDKGECFAKCRLGRRCHTLAYLHSAGYDRPWSGKLSTTQLLAPYRISYLKITESYYIDPEERAFAVLGTWAHHKLDIFAKKADLLSEYKLDDENNVGVLDLLEPDCEKDGYFVLSDHKTWGSYAVFKAIKDGDIGDAALQLNDYRIKVENDLKLAEILGIPITVSRMQVEAIIRDGGTFTARNNNCAKRVYLIDIPKLPDEQVTSYFKQRADDLLGYLARKEMPPMCTSEESWNYKRCKTFCDIRAVCDIGVRINKKR